MPSGRVLVVGGRDDDQILGAPEILDFGEEPAWLAAGAMKAARFQLTASLLQDGSVLVVGGREDLKIHASAERFRPLAGGLPCNDPGECDSVLCANGVCCDQACTGPCLACTAAEKGGGADGECGPLPGNPCGAYECDPSGKCKTSCETDDDCTSTYHCREGLCSKPDSAVCDGDHSLVRDDGAVVEDCRPARCSTETNDCNRPCGTNLDCLPGYECLSESGNCVERTVSELGSGCGCRIDEGGPRGVVIGLLALGAWMGVLRRRRRCTARGKGWLS